MFVYNPQGNESVTTQRIAEIDLKAFDDLLSTDKSSHKKKILSFIVLTTDACPSCLNNVSEYAQLIKQNEYFFEPVLIFVDEEKPLVERFVQTRGLDIPLKLLSSDVADPIFSEAKQNLIFVDRESNKAIYNFVIPNAVTSIEHKSSTIEESISKWIAK